MPETNQQQIDNLKDSGVNFSPPFVGLIECLVGGSRFLNEAEAIKVEDVSIEIKDIINELYKT